MNVPSTTERVLSDGTGRRPMMVTWRGEAGNRLESARILLQEARVKASGRVVAADSDEHGAYNASFELSVGEDGVVSRLLLRSTTAEQERQVSISRTEDGVWLVDHGGGAKRSEFAGAVDVNVESTVLFNALPVRRLGLHRKAGEHELPVVWVALPDLSVRLVRESYRTVSINEGSAVIGFTRDSVETDLTVDASGLVVDYPGLATRV